MDLKKLYFKALRWAIEHYPDAPVEHQRAFAASVAQLCGDNPHRPLNLREKELVDLLHTSGGPSVREHACLWAAYKRGDAIQTSYEGMAYFYNDSRFQTPGTWDFEFACKFCEQLAFGKLTNLHHQVWKQEAKNCFDDFIDDVRVLAEGQEEGLAF